MTKRKTTAKPPDFGTMREAYVAFGELVFERGVPFRIDLAGRNMTVGGKTVVKDGRFFGTASPLDVPEGPGGALRMLDSLYEVYKRSVPGERDGRDVKRGAQFFALPFDELSDDDVLHGERRNAARYALEAFVLFAIMNGQLKWDDRWGTWFYRSPYDRDLVLLKEWFEFKPKNRDDRMKDKDIDKDRKTAKKIERLLPKGWWVDRIDWENGCVVVKCPILEWTGDRNVFDDKIKKTEDVLGAKYDGGGANVGSTDYDNYFYVDKGDKNPVLYGKDGKSGKAKA